MSLKQEIETWVAALVAYDNNDFDQALRFFQHIADTSKILFNLGVINATLGDHARAVSFYQQAVALDQYLAVAYFQQGVSNFLMGDFEEALANFNDTLLYLRGNKYIDYEQLGLKFKLYSCEVLFNRGLCYIYLQQKEAGLQDMEFAAKEKAIPDHDVIDEAIKEQAEGYTVFSIPVGVVYRPNEAKVKNLKTKNYLGKARLVAQQNQSQQQPYGTADERLEDKLLYAALHFKKADLRSRARQQSEPPLSRNVFPPTPPPEAERPDSAHGLAARRPSDSSATTQRSQPRAPAAKPAPLELGIAAFDQSAQHAAAPRIGTKRSESERPMLRREYSNGSSGRGQQPSRRAAGSGEYSGHHQRAPDIRVEPDSLEAYSPNARIPDQQRRTSSSAQMQQQRNNAPLTISEENEDVFEEDDGDELIDQYYSPLAFEIIPPGKQPPPYASSNGGRNRSSRPAPPLRKLRIKVHGEDMRYVLATPDTSYDALVEQIRAKFSLGIPAASAFKLKMKDEEGDLVTMGDQEDWDMAVGIAKAVAKKERSELGRLEVWVQEI